MGFSIKMKELWKQLTYRSDQTACWLPAYVWVIKRKAVYCPVSPARQAPSEGFSPPLITWHHLSSASCLPNCCFSALQLLSMESGFQMHFGSFVAWPPAAPPCLLPVSFSDYLFLMSCLTAEVWSIASDPASLPETNCKPVPDIVNILSTLYIVSSVCIWVHLCYTCCQEWSPDM